MSHAFHTIMFQFHIQGVDEEMRAKAREGLIQPIQEISTGEDGYVIKTTVGHLSTEVRFKLGISFPSSSMDGKKIMVTKNSDLLVLFILYSKHYQCCGYREYMYSSGHKNTLPISVNFRFEVKLT